MRGIVRYPDLRVMLFFLLILIPIFILTYRTDQSAYAFPLDPFTFFAISLLFLLLSMIEVVIFEMKMKKPHYTEREIEELERLYSIPREEIEGEDGRLYNSTITLNLGGFILPLIFALYIALISPLALEELVIITAIMIALTNLLASIVPGVGIVIPPYVGLFALPLALIVTPEDVITGMLVSGIIGIELGLITKIFSIDRELGSPVFSIGGRGSFESIYIPIILGLLFALW
ncbi:MAG: DUF1614 domain-containing protein [Candidatus Syntrophoarchaeum sp. WYZ-LMO15]|nr:MAG: DUF1614 domain-containing protein [Candidatus Syntrophoarchaeum sp. WYZ-LMO15]